MSSTIFFFLFIPLLSLILLTINIVFAPHNPYLEKNNAFECGFTSFLGQNRIQFSISFFIFALLFLLFDLEILLVYPYLMSAYINEAYGLLILMTFLGILTIGFVFELGKKALTIDSRQTVLSNCNSIKKSLSVMPLSAIPNTISPVLNSILLKNLFKYSVLLKKILKNTQVRHMSFNSSLHVRKNCLTELDRKSNDNTLRLTNRSFYFSSVSHLQNRISRQNSTTYNNTKRSFSTTSSLKGIGITDKIEKLDHAKSAIKSAILEDRPESYYYEEHGRILWRRNYFYGESGRVPANRTNFRPRNSYEATVQSHENYIIGKVEKLERLKNEHCNQLSILQRNNLPDNQLPSLDNDRISSHTWPHEIQTLKFVQDTLDRPLSPKPAGLKLNAPSKEGITNRMLGVRLPCPPYKEHASWAKSQGVNLYVEGNREDETNSSGERPAAIFKPSLINRDLNGYVIPEPLKPVDITVGLDVLRDDDNNITPLNKKWRDEVKNTKQTEFLLGGVKDIASRSGTGTVIGSDADSYINTITQATVCFSISFGEINPWLRLLSILMCMYKAHYNITSFFQLKCIIKRTFSIPLVNVIVTVRSIIAFVIKSTNFIVNDPNNCNNSNNCNGCNNGKKGKTSYTNCHNFCYQSYKIKLTVSSSMFNVERLLTKVFFKNYICSLKDKFNYKWVISMVLAIMFTYCFRTMLICKLNSWGLDLSSIVVISALITSASVFFKSVLHLMECLINNETDKMLMGPNDPIQVKLPKNSIDASIALKKDNVNIGISDESKQDANKKLNFQGLPYDMRSYIADYAGINEKGLNKLLDSGSSTQDRLYYHIKIIVRWNPESGLLYPTRTTLWGVKYIPTYFLREDYEELLAYRRKLNNMEKIRKILVPETSFDANRIQNCKETADATIKIFYDLAKDAVWECDVKDKELRKPNAAPSIGDRYKKEISENTNVFGNKPK